MVEFDYVEVIPLSVAIAVLWHFGTQQGPEPNRFDKALVTTIVNADTANQKRLALGFYEYVTAVQCATRLPDGLERLRILVERGY